MSEPSLLPTAPPIRSRPAAYRTFWFAFAPTDRSFPSGCGITASSRADAEWLLAIVRRRWGQDRPVVSVIEDVVLADLDPRIAEHCGDPAIRGVWYPSFGTNPFYFHLLPLIETFDAGYEGVALAAEMIAADARHNQAAIDRKFGPRSKVNDGSDTTAKRSWTTDDWLVSLAYGERAHQECRAAVDRFNAGGIRADLIKSLRHAAALMARPTRPEATAPSRKNRLVACLQPLIANNAAGPDGTILAAAVIAADSRAMDWATKAMPDEGVSSEGWTELLEIIEAGLAECEAAMRAFAATGDRDALVAALRHAAETLDRRPGAAMERRSRSPGRAIAALLAPLVKDGVPSEIRRLAERAIWEEWEADFWAVERRLDRRLSPEEWTLFRSWNDTAVAECLTAVQLCNAGGNQDLLAKSLTKAAEFLQRRPAQIETSGTW